MIIMLSGAAQTILKNDYKEEITLKVKTLWISYLSKVYPAAISSLRSELTFHKEGVSYSRAESQPVQRIFPCIGSLPRLLFA